MVYLGHLPQQMTATVSYKNHKHYKRDKSEWVVTYNSHPPIISQELWDRARERQKSVSHGKSTKTGHTHPLSGFLYCADYGGKLRLSTVGPKDGKERLAFNCGNHNRFGKAVCFSHFIMANTLEKIILDDIREMAQRIVIDEDAIRKEFIKQNAELADKAVKNAKKELTVKQRRVEELSRLMQVAYEDRVKGIMPEDICVRFIGQYDKEQKTLIDEIAELEKKISETETEQQSMDDFIQNIKKFFDAPELTREMCYTLLDRVVVGGLPKVTGKERTIDIVYKVDISSVLRYKFKK